ncbi:unnamed protein product [Clonostachys rhizophaga]|uniref:Uncharacterized protein n=1 Tax=Clonostachys rhizophaga TaxID=160324 RepID=A0A9N9V5X9_9HYPO|nr:unnamed protein product [Clonostachys rhizophaga]
MDREREMELAPSMCGPESTNGEMAVRKRPNVNLMELDRNEESRALDARRISPLSKAAELRLSTLDGSCQERCTFSGEEPSAQVPDEADEVDQFSGLLMLQASLRLPSHLELQALQWISASKVQATYPPPSATPALPTKPKLMQHASGSIHLCASEDYSGLARFAITAGS